MHTKKPPDQNKYRKEELKINRFVKLALIAIVAYALVYSIIFAQGPSFFGDDIAYAWFAHYALTGHFIQSNDILSLRLLQIYPISFFYIFGINLYTLSAWDTLSFLCTIVIIFFIGKEIYNDYVGLLAALLFAFFPLIVSLSTTLSDTLPMTLFISLAMLAILYAQRRSSAKWYFVAGVSLVASMLTIPLAALATILVILYLIVEIVRKKIKINKTLAYFAYGFVFALLILMLFNYANVKSPLITFSENYNFFQKNYNQTYGQTYNPQTSTLSFYIKVMFPYPIINTLAKALSNAHSALSTMFLQMYKASILNDVGFYFYAALIALGYLVLKKEKHSYFIIFWLVVGFLLLEFDPAHISLSPFSYLLQHRLDRYLMFISPAAVLVISAAIVHAMERAKKSKLKFHLVAAIIVLSVVFLIITAIPINHEYYSLTQYARQTQIETAKYLTMLPSNTRIYVYLGQVVPIYMQFANSSRIIVYEAGVNCNSIVQSSLMSFSTIQNSYTLNTIAQNSYIVIPTNANAQQHCPTWKLAFAPLQLRTTDQIAKSFGSTDQVTLYYIPYNASSNQTLNNTDGR